VLGLHAQLREKDETDREPDDEEPDKDPEQERGLTDGQPSQLVTVEEKLRTPRRLPVSVVFDDLASDGLPHFEGPLALGVDVNDPAAPLVRVVSRAWHDESLPGSANALRATLTGGRSKPSGS
jgi:hypothetical protein